MTWGELESLLNEQAEKVFAMAYLPFVEFPQRPDLLADVLLDAQVQTRERVERACERFAETRRWVPLTPAEKGMLLLRLEYAAGLCGLLGAKVPFYEGLIAEPSLDVPEEHALRWLLIFAWTTEGFPQMHSNLERVQRAARREMPPANPDQGETAQ